MKINFEAHTIELTKAENKAASAFGSNMYKALREARQDNPSFTVVVSKRTRKLLKHPDTMFYNKSWRDNALNDRSSFGETKVVVMTYAKFRGKQRIRSIYAVGRARNGRL